MDTAHRVGVYGWTPGQGGVHHHRIAEPLRALALRGATAFHGVELDDDVLNRVDTVLVHTLHDERNSRAWERLAELGSHRLILDVDDAMWAPDWPPFRDHYRPSVLRRLYRNIELAHVVTTPSDVLAAQLARHNRNVWVVPNTVPAWLTDWTMPAREHPTVGYQGSPSHARDWTTAHQRGLAMFLREHPDWHLHLWGSAPGELGTSGRVHHTPWSGSVTAYYRSLSMDIGVGPLRATPFNMGKSSLRAVEYAALGVVAVLPDLAPYRGWVHDGVTGRLIRPHQTMRRVLAEVAADPDHRAAMSAKAREIARGWTTEANVHRWVEAWQSQ